MVSWKLLKVSIFLFIILTGVLGSVSATTWTPTEVITAGTDRLIALQNANGSWDWDVPDKTAPTTTTYLNIAGVTAEGVLDAYKVTGDVKYLDAAKKTGDYIILEINKLSDARHFNAFNMVFLKDLAEVSGDTIYSDFVTKKMNDLFTKVTNHTYGVISTDGVDGLTAEELVAAEDVIRGTAMDGIKSWDLYHFVELAKYVGNNVYATQIANGIKSQIENASYNDSISNFELGLAAGIIALKEVELSYNPSLERLIAKQNLDGSFGTISDGQVQATSYSLIALTFSGNKNNLGLSYLRNKFRYNELNGWKESDGKEYAEVNSEAIQAIFNYDVTSPTMTVTGFTADSLTMSGDKLNGFVLNTNNNSTKEYLIQFADGTSSSEFLSDEYFGLKLISSTVSVNDLKEYYTARNVPEPFLTYLKDAVDGTNPFVYIKGNTIRLIDAARHDILGTDTDMAIPGDYPLGTYVVSGKIYDLAGNEVIVIYKLIVARKISNEDGTKSVTLPKMNLSSDDTSSIQVEIPEGLVVTGNSSWTGILNAPSLKEITYVTPIASKGKNINSTGSVIELGVSNMKLTFNKAVRILIPGQAGKLVGYSVSGTDFTPITTICADDTQTTNNLLSTGKDCKLNVGSDLIIWTKHFTTFVTYTETPIIHEHNRNNDEYRYIESTGEVIVTESKVIKLSTHPSDNFFTGLSKFLTGAVTGIGNFVSSGAVIMSLLTLLIAVVGLTVIVKLRK